MDGVDEAIPPHSQSQKAAETASAFHMLINQNEGQQRARQPDKSPGTNGHVVVGPSVMPARTIARRVFSGMQTSRITLAW